MGWSFWHQYLIDIFWWIWPKLFACLAVWFSMFLLFSHKLPSLLCDSDFSDVFLFVLCELPFPSFWVDFFEIVSVIYFNVSSASSVGEIVHSSVREGCWEDVHFEDCENCMLNISISCWCSKLTDSLVVLLCISRVGEKKIPVVWGLIVNGMVVDACCGERLLSACVGLGWTVNDGFCCFRGGMDGVKLIEIVWPQPLFGLWPLEVWTRTWPEFLSWFTVGMDIWNTVWNNGSFSKSKMHWHNL